MQTNQTALVLAILATLLIACQALRPVSIDDGNSNNKLANQYEQNSSRYEDYNEIDDEEEEDRIRLIEPYKSIVQTTVRFALAQPKISNHINIDEAMSLLNDAAYAISKPSILSKVFKLLAILIATLTSTTFFFPATYRAMDSLWKDPISTLNLDKHFGDGVEERSLVGAIGLRAEELLKRLGLQDPACRERSLCYVGEIVKCTFPISSESLIKFASENFSQTAYKENRYFKAFSSGIVDRNCTKVGIESGEKQTCLGNFFKAFVAKKPSAKKSGKKLQPRQQRRSSLQS